MCTYFLTANQQSKVMKSNERQFFSEYRTYDVSLYSNAYLRKKALDGLFHVIKSLIILIASFIRGYIMMQEILSKNGIFKCKNCVPHVIYYFTLKMSFFVIHFFVTLKKL